MHFGENQLSRSLIGLSPLPTAHPPGFQPWWVRASILYELTHGRIPLIGVGGIFTAEDAWEKIAAGASLVQIYTGFIYQGPRIATQISEDLSKIIAREGFPTLDAAVGKGVRNPRYEK